MITLIQRRVNRPWQGRHIPSEVTCLTGQSEDCAAALSLNHQKSAAQSRGKPPAASAAYVCCTGSGEFRRHDESVALDGFIGPQPLS